MKVIFRRGLKNNIKDELMRTEARTETLIELIQEFIRFDDQIYERVMKKRHDHGKKVMSNDGPYIEFRRKNTE